MMQTKDKIELYKESLANNKERRFNIWAFLFSSFYFWYLGMFGYFCLFAFLPIILSFPISLLIEEIGLAFWVGFIISHLIAGFIADKSYTKYRENYIKSYENVDTQKEVEYFAISLPRLIISTVLSGGIYAIYWGYKNWNYYQKTTHDAVNPYLRAWFFDWTAISLFDKINYSTKTLKFHTFFGAACLTIFIINTIISQMLIDGYIPDNWTFATSVSLLILMLIYPFCLVPAQIAINRHTTQVLQKTLDKHFYPWEIVILLLGIVLNLYSWFGEWNMPEDSFTEEESQKMGASVGFIYRHTQGYADVCQKQGYVLKQYPEDFNNLYAKEIEALDLALNNKGYSREEVEKAFITPQIDASIKQSVQEELEQLRKLWIMFAIADEKNIPIENMTWKEEYNAKLTLKDACEIFDAGGIELLKESENNNFLKNNSL